VNPATLDRRRALDAEAIRAEHSLDRKVATTCDRGEPLGSLQVTLSPEAMDDLAERVADRVLAQLDSREDRDRWLDSAEAAAYLAMTTSALHKLTAARKVPFSQDAPGGKCYFKRADLDAWRRSE
jgi:excisionase family DNA binding protein